MSQPKRNNSMNFRPDFSTALSLVAVLSLFAALNLFIFTPCARAQNEPILEASPEEKQAILDELFKSDEDVFVYNSRNSSDPFVPFITEEIVRAEIQTDVTKLTGLQKYEPGQLTLVAIIFSNDRPLAMVQDSSGKGYIIRKGTKLGRSGEVDDILPNTVLIKQMSYTPTKQQVYKTVEMILKKEGEK